jgi:hypothetical protein
MVSIAPVNKTFGAFEQGALHHSRLGVELFYPFNEEP